MKTSIQRYFESQIIETVSRSLGLEISEITISDGKLSLVCNIAGEGSQQLFWQAVLELQRLRK